MTIRRRIRRIGAWWRRLEQMARPAQPVLPVRRVPPVLKAWLVRLAQPALPVLRVPPVLKVRKV